MRLGFGDVWVDDDNCYMVEIILHGIRGLTRDGDRVGDVRMEKKDAGVIAFKRTGNSAELVVTSTSYAPQIEETRSYRFDFTSFDLRAEGQG